VIALVQYGQCLAPSIVRSRVGGNVSIEVSRQQSRNLRLVIGVGHFIV